MLAMLASAAGAAQPSAMQSGGTWTAVSIERPAEVSAARGEGEPQS